MTTVIASCTRGAGSVSDQFVVLEGTGYAGDLVLTEVVSVGAYPRVENIHGRDVRIRPGDQVVGVLGDRHSTTSIYGGLPQGGLQVRCGDRADLMAIGGVVGIAESCPTSLGPATELRLLGLAGNTDGQVVRLIPKSADVVPEVPLVLVGGTAAEVGKTTFAAALVHHLAIRHGKRVGVTKLAGTGRLRDLLTLADAGAHCAADFVTAGLGTTYGHDETVVAAAARYLLNRLADDGAEIIVAELGGDLWGAGIPGIVRDPEIAAQARFLVLVPSDTMASLGAETWLKQNGIAIPAVHGVPYRNVLAARERLGRGMGVRPVDPSDAADLERLAAEITGAAPLPAGGA